MQYYQCHCLRHQGAKCTLCVEACPYGALQWSTRSGGKPELRRDEAQCRACGLCACVCPVGIFAPHPANAQVVHCLCLLPEKKHLVLLCQACVHEALPDTIDTTQCHVLRLPACPSALHPSVYAAFVALGIRRVDCLCAACERCELYDNGRGMRHTQQVWQHLLGNTFSIHTNHSAHAGTNNCQVLPVASPPLSRRDFLKSMLMPSATHKVLQALLGMKAEQWVDARHPVLSREFRNILHACKGVFAPDTPLPPLVRHASFTVDSQLCTACGSCARVCPTGAMFTAHNGAQFTLNHVLGLCVDCGLCHTVCHDGALQHRHTTMLVAHWLSREPQLLFKHAVRHCRRCRALFRPMRQEAGLCRFCEARYE